MSPGLTIMFDDPLAAVLESRCGPPEFFDAWRRKDGTAAEELMDVAIYVLGLAEMTWVDLEAEIEAKMRKNGGRVCRRNENGALVRIDDAQPSR